jgi:hypothetical protein
MDVVSKMLGFISTGRDRQHRFTGVMDRCGQNEGTDRLGDRYGRVSAHELLHLLVRQQVE